LKRSIPRLVPAFLVWLLLCFLTAALFGRPFHLPLLAYNTSPSLPRGLYLRTHDEYAPGSLVLACLPISRGVAALHRGYLDQGGCPGGASALGKVLLAGGGDVVDFDADGLRRNGVLVPGSGPLVVDSRGRSLPHARFGRYALRPGEVWLYSPFHPRSFDSRYFGPLLRENLLATLAPVWIETSGLPQPHGFRLRAWSSHVN
jgi:conjugative transfer signal peptidase TraF